MASDTRSSRKSGVLSALLTAALLFSTLASAGVQLKGRPLKHNHLHAAVDLSKRVDMQPAQASSPGHVTHSGFKTVGYYVSWAIYGRDWPPSNIQSQQLTHLLYAFAGIDNKTGAVSLGDTFADIEKKFPTDDASDNSTDNLYGNLKQIYIHKKHNRNLKTLLSIGGWNIRTYFAPALATAQNRKTFARTSVELLKDHGLDGLDIDWEYPNTTQQAHDLVATCKEVRMELDNYSRNLTGNPHFLLTLAVPAGPDHFRYFDMAGLAPYVDFVNLMGYDYAGTFSEFSGHAANVYKSEENPLSTNFSTQDAVNYYLGESGWDKQKFTLGMPLYGRSFANTSGPGTVFNNETGGSWENGAWDYKALAGNSSFGDVYTDFDIVASWSYNKTNGYMVTYDTPTIATKKAEYVKNLGIGGAMWWELSGDTPVNGSSSLIRAVTDYFDSCGGLEQCQNVLDYPQSRYTNLRRGMPGN